MKNRIIGSVVQKARNYRVNRKYKDRLFRLVFQDKEDLLSLYNAVNSTEHTNAEDLTIKTLEDAVYLGFKNDLSFLISNTLNLYEHQSSINPNMPLRGLIYFTEMLKAYVEEQGYNIYGTKRVLLPTPKYIVFYNGLQEQPDRMELHLSEAFLENKEKDEPSLECRAIMLNINQGHNQELMEKCQRLEGYSYFVAAVFTYMSRGYELEDAINLAIDECVKKGKIADILAKNRAEVKNMLLTDFDEKKYRKMLREEARQEGWEQGKEEGRKEGTKEGREERREDGKEEGREAATKRINRLNKCLIQDERFDDLRRSAEDVDYQKRLIEEYNIE